MNAARTAVNNIAITDAGATQRQIPTPHPRKGRHPAQRTNTHANHGKQAGKRQLRTNSKTSRCLRLSRPDNKTIYAHNRIINLMFRRQRSKSEKTAARAINANSSQPPASAFCSGAARKTQKAPSRKKENREKYRESRRVGKPSAPRQRTVQTIKQTINKMTISAARYQPSARKGSATRRWQIPLMLNHLA